MKNVLFVGLFVVVLTVLLISYVRSKNATPDVPALALAFADPEWNGKTIPEGQQCQRFGSQNPSSPRIIVSHIPKGANALIMEFSDRTYKPMDKGGHGKIGFRIAEGKEEVVIPSVPGHSFDLPEGFFIVKEHQGSDWDKAGAYMPPCSGGKGNSYYVTVKAVKQSVEKAAESHLLAQSVLELGKY